MKRTKAFKKVLAVFLMFSAIMTLIFNSTAASRVAPNYGISIKETSIRIEIGQTHQIDYTKAETVSGLTWSSSNINVATV